jgi:hypothetical protein
MRERLERSIERERQRTEQRVRERSVEMGQGPKEFGDGWSSPS